MMLFAGQLTAQWNWQQPRPQGNDLWKVSFAPLSTTGWAVGGAGVIAVTSDAGATWTVQESGVDDFLRGTCAVSVSQAWAVGDNGRVLLTNDGGMSWSSQASGTTAGINQLYAVSASEAWFVGDAGMIRHTANAGVTWSAQNSGSSNNINDVAFTSATNGICVGASKTVLRTTNGGVNWSQVSISGPGSYDLIGVYFLNASLGWAAGTFGSILRTTNGGVSWTRSTAVGSGADFNSVVFLDANTGYACGESGALVKSTNGGVSWSSVAVSSNGLESIAASAASVVAVGVFGDILQSTGGAFANVLSGSRATLNAVACAGSQDAWAVGEAGTILATTDGGATWTRQANGLVAASLYGAAATDAQHAWICGAGGLILRTTSGGAAWAPQTSGQSVALNGIDFPSASVGYAVGLSGKIIKTTNGGTTWGAIASGTLDDLNGIDMLTDSIGAAVGANGVILFTTNAGASWQRQSSFTQDALFSVTLSGDNGWICGDAGTILVTTDAGQTWDQVVTNQASPLFRIVQTSSNDLAAFGDAGLILRTTDAGASWTQERSHAMYSFYGAAAGGSTVHAVGDFGMALANGSYPTPVTFLSFTGTASGTLVHLQWETADERFNAGFDVQRLDAGRWHPVGFVPAYPVSKYRMRYSYNDDPEGATSVRYRLRQVDLDGACAYSPVLEVALGADGDGFGLGAGYPNPAAETISFEVLLPSSRAMGDVTGMTLRLYDARGGMVSDLTAALRDAAARAADSRRVTVTADRANFPEPGMYFIRLMTPNAAFTRPVLRVR
ncbi:MAG: hypothetical protein IPP94_00915 [Ignavibacteria bacterium]|nr:hypothetical protein [Ignavibacteria bacterium]